MFRQNPMMQQPQPQAQQNPLSQILQQAQTSGQNPMQLLQQQLSQNPQMQQAQEMQQQMQRVQQMLSGKSPQEQEQTFRNACKSAGVDPDQMIQQYMPQMRPR